MGTLEWLLQKQDMELHAVGRGEGAGTARGSLALHETLTRHTHALMEAADSAASMQVGGEPPKK